MDDIDDPGLFRVGTQMGFSHIIISICRDLRVMDALVLVLNIGMDSDLDVIVVKFLKSNHRGSCQQTGVKAEGQFDRSVFLLRFEGLTGADFFAGSILQRFPVCLVHQCSLYCIGPSDNKVGIGDDIDKGGLLIDSPGRIPCDAVFGISRDGGIENRLVLIFQVCVAGYFNVVIEKILKYDACVVSQFPGKYVCVQCESHFDASFCILGIKLRRRSDLLAVLPQDRLAGSFIHQDAGDCIMVAWHQVFISHRINHGRLSGHSADFVFCFPIPGIGADLGVMDALVLILDVRMNSNPDLIVVKVLESDNSLSRQKGGIKGEGNLHGSFFFRRCEGLFGTNFLPGSVFQGFPGLLIHKDTRHCVFLSRNKVMIGDNVFNDCFFRHSAGMPSGQTVFGIGLYGRHVDGFSLIGEILP